MLRHSKITRLLAAVALLSAGLVSTPVHAAETCAAAKPELGEWRSYGGGLENQRNQKVPQSINAGNAFNIKAAWAFSATNAAQSGTANGGTFQNTPVVADGCVFLGSSTGFVFALNAETGKRVWTSAKMPGSAAGSLLGGVIIGSPTVANGIVYVGVAAINDPKVAAIDEATGQTLWIRSILDPARKQTKYRTNTVSAPVVWDGLIFQGIMAEESTADPRGGYAILDAQTGDLLTQEFTISDAEYVAGFRGASVWCTAALDAATGMVYACGGNPASKQQESRYSNALLKIDMNCPHESRADCRAANPNFGKIVGAYKGNYDQYYPGLDRQPACDQVPTTIVWSPTCVQMDLDFGASPSLYKVNVGGSDVMFLGDLQKSGVYQAVFADNMQQAWSTVVGGPAAVYNASSPAVDGTNVYTLASPPGQIVGLSKDRGRYRWVAPTGGAPTFQSVSVASGVVYAMDNTNFLSIIDASTGLLIKRWPLSVDAGTYVGDQSSQGVSIARNTVFAASGSAVVAYN